MKNFNVYLKRKQKDYNYYNYFLKYQDINYYMSIYNKTDVINVQEPFLKNNSAMLKLKKSNIVKQYGKPCFKKHSELDKSHFILFYNITFLKYRILKSFHFLNHKLILVNMTFQHISNEEKLKLINKIKEVYDIDSEKFTSVKIVDCENNILFIEDLFELSVNYMSSNTETLKNKYEAIKKLESKTKKQENSFLTHLLENII